MNNRDDISKVIRDFLFSTKSREFLIFLFFLALSGVFWLLMTLNETYEREFEVAVRIIDAPKNVVLTSDETDTVKVTLTDKGMVLLGYAYGDGLKPLTFDFNSHVTEKGLGSITSAEIQKLMVAQVKATTKVGTIKPDKLDFYFNYGLRKKVPVRWTGKVTPEHLYFVSRIEYSPDSITVYASEEKLDSIHTIYTEPINVTDFRDTLSVKCNLSKSVGVKTVPDNVTITFYTDVLTEESIDDVPIEGINVPEGKTIRTFPSRVSVKFVTGVSQFKGLSAKDFRVVVDYNDIMKHPSDKCILSLKKVPRGISRASLSIKQVDYLIEEDEEETPKQEE